MAEPTVLEFLEKLRKERDEINSLISGLERRLGVAPAPVSNDPVQSPTSAKISVSEIPVGFFHNMSQPAATEKLLRLNPGHPLTTPEILDAFRRSGLYLNPKNATTILYTALNRNPKFERVAGKAWGLAEWYPESKRKDNGKKVDLQEKDEPESAS